MAPVRCHRCNGNGVNYVLAEVVPEAELGAGTA
jgi:hypothetical protein